ncbi:hypothetical protein ACQP1O_17755 [Nocardia sp. CA-151230]|uniref:hypothetical protein n=1 Tax=Nocardia sp. CA-151230 TaxID=3239982 RepID=UPI003D918727
MTSLLLPVDMQRPQYARVHGKDNYAPDRQFADLLLLDWGTGGHVRCTGIAAVSSGHCR